MCSVPLKTVLKSEALFLEKIIDIKDRSDPSGQGSEVTVIGNLKVRTRTGQGKWLESIVSGLDVGVCGREGGGSVCLWWVCGGVCGGCVCVYCV